MSDPLPLGRRAHCFVGPVIWASVGEPVELLVERSHRDYLASFELVAVIVECNVSPMIELQCKLVPFADEGGEQLKLDMGWRGKELNGMLQPFENRLFRF